MADTSEARAISGGYIQRWVDESWLVRMAVIGHHRASARLTSSAIGQGWQTARRNLPNSPLYRWLTADVSGTSTVGSYSYHVRAWLVVLLSMMVVGLIAATRFLSPWVGVVALAFGVSLFGLRQYWRGNALLAVLTAGYLFRLGIIVLNSQVGVLTQPDISISHHERAMTLADAWLSGQFGGVLETGTMERLMAYIHAPFYVFLGRMQLVGELGTAFYGIVVGYATYTIAKQLTTYRNAVFAAGATVFWPSILYRTVVIQREILVTLAMLTVVWVALRLTQPNHLYERAHKEGGWRIAHWTKRLPATDIALLSVAATAVFVLRPENLVIIGITLAAALFFRNKPTSRNSIIIGILLMILLFYFALNFGQFTGAGATITPGTIDKYAHARAHGGSAYLTNLHYRSWFDIILYAPMKVVYFLFSPLPWQVNSLTGFFAGVSGLGLLVATALSGRGFAVLRNLPEKRATLAAYAISGILAYSIIEMNAGAAFRRRIQFVPIILILAVVALSSISLRNHFCSLDSKPTPADSESSITMRED